MLTGKQVGYLQPFTLSEAAEWAGVSENTMRSIARREGLGTKVNRTWYFGQRELAEFFLGPAAGDRERARADFS